jgi:hypothetical protein
MNSISWYCRVASRIVWLLGIVMLTHFSRAAALKEDTFDELQINGATYKNVTVTTKAKTYIFLLHSSGMANIRVADLSPEVREKLGYTDFDKPKVSTNAAAAWATQTITKIETPEVQEMKQKVKEQLESYFPGGRPTLASVDVKLLALAGGIVLTLYLCFSYCSMLICRKAGKPGGFLVWVPSLQLIPLLRAAGMSPAWFLVWFLPFVISPIIASLPRTPLLVIGYLGFLAIAELLVLIATIIWCFKIAKARGKSALVGVLLLLPLINIFAFLYLAFSEGAAEDNRRFRPKRVELMTLETA